MLSGIRGTSQQKISPGGQSSLVVHVLSTAEVKGTAQVKIVAALAKRGAASTIRFEAWILGEKGPLVPLLESAGVRCRLVSFSGGIDPVGSARFAAALRTTRPALVHMHSGSRLLVYLIRQLTDAQIVAHLHGTHAEDGQAIDLHRFVAAADAVIANSTGVAIQAAPGAEVIHPGVDLPARTTATATGRPIIGAMSRLEPIKQLPDLVEIGAILHRAGTDFGIEIVGAGSDEARLRVETAAAGLDRRVEFLGWQSDPTEIFERWSVFASTSAHEGFGLSVLEAMAAGLPVVATATAGSRDLVVDGVTGFLVANGDTRGFADRVALLLGDQELRMRTGAAARARAGDTFSERVMVDRTIALYERLVDPSGS